MPVVTARRADSAGKKKGRERHIPGTFQIHRNGTDNDKGSSWRTQLLVARHHVSPSLADQIFSLCFGEVRDA